MNENRLQLNQIHILELAPFFGAFFIFGEACPPPKEVAKIFLNVKIVLVIAILAINMSSNTLTVFRFGEFCGDTSC